MKNKLVIIFILLFCNCLITFSQTNNLPGIIPSFFYKGKVNKRFDYNIFTSCTFIPVKSVEQGKQYTTRFSEVFLQSSIIYKYSKDVNFALGYTYIAGNSFSEKVETQHQIWQQAIVEHRIFKGYMLHRFRLIENINNKPAVLLNYQIAFEKPLQGRVLDVKEFYFSFFNEAFLNVSSFQTKFYTADWAFIGIGYKTPNAGRIEVGPLVQTIFNSNNNHSTLFLLQILWLTDYTIHKRKK